MARRNLRRFRALVFGVVGGVQVPGVAALAHLLGNWSLPVAGAALLSLPYLAGLRSPFEDRPKGRLHIYAGLLPFFAWWAACLVFLALGPIALLLGRAAGLPFDRALALGLGASVVAGISAIRTRPRLT